MSRSQDLSRVLWSIAFLLGLAAVSGAQGTDDSKLNAVIGDKTLIAWVAPANLSQRGGSVLTIEKSGGIFDGIIFAELAEGKWMAGSNGFHRTQKEQSDGAAETTDPQTVVQVAVVYRGEQIQIYRNGALQAEYDVDSPVRFASDSIVLMGLRHLAAQPENRFFTGVIDDARLYNMALTGEQIATLVANQPSDPSRQDSLGVTVFANGASATIRNLEAWDMMPANPY